MVCLWICGFDPPSVAQVEADSESSSAPAVVEQIIQVHLMDFAIILSFCSLRPFWKHPLALVQVKELDNQKISKVVASRSLVIKLNQ